MWIELSLRRAQVRAALASGVVVALLAGCATQEPAPIEQKSPQSLRQTRPAAAKPHTGPSTDQPPAVYSVVAGDTLYAIAWRFGLDARDIGRWNRLDDFNRIFVGQKLKLKESLPPPALRPAERVPPVVSTQGAVTPSAAVTLKALPPVMPPPAVTGAKPVASPVAPAGTVSAAPPVAASGTLAPPVSAPSVAAEAPPSTPGAAATTATDDAADGNGRAAGGLVWRWPASGKSRPTVAATGAKGVDILGKRGQAVSAAADGQVVYSGSGLRGYGQLIIIKHNDSFLSAYAHNDKLLVSEGNKVKAGQPIAQMGDSEADEVMLHFEIRKGGKAVEPLQFLPSR